MPSSERPPTLDPAAAARWAALPVRQGLSPWLHEEIASRMLERLDFIRLQPQQWAHWEPLRGGIEAHRQLLQRYPKAPVWLVAGQPSQARAALEASRGRWWQLSRWTGPATALSTPPAGAVQMLWANMLLHHAADPQALIADWHRALAVDGFLMFSCLGPDTLRELRQIYAQKGWPEPAHEFTDMHDWGDMLVHAGFAEPVMDMERITLSYETPERLLAELRELGRNLHGQRFSGLRGRRWRAQLLQALQALARPDEQGRFCLTFEVVYGHALKPVPRHKVQSESQIGLQDMRQMLQARKAGFRQL
ncbi:class I SAM-dependent methyltransferase [Limnohabitans radicicola]|uniref:Biotin synthase n=1 Tax=Limnohabitans radicicola TaxID=2771427 RepID=A0A927FL61_9BURK|nr:biotin synthase [Limnohabitans radicicola]MBD8051535.1 biotin synthase [Limnohabitans radicicola]